MIKLILLLCTLLYVNADIKDECDRIVSRDINVDILSKLAKHSVANLDDGNRKGDAGRIAVIGGSFEYSGNPYFSAISSLKMGADLVSVITTREAAPIIKNYSPDLIVYPYLDDNKMDKINTLLTKVNLVILGPGLGRTNEAINRAVEIIRNCKELHIPMVIDADGLYAVAKHPKVLKNYLRPGVILTPNFNELERLMNNIGVNDTGSLIEYWGPYVNILAKGRNDSFSSFYLRYDWEGSFGGSERRTGGQGDMLTGILGTFFNWALRMNLCNNDSSDNLAASVSSFVASKITRISNEQAFKINGRSMLGSDMLNYISYGYNKLFDNNNNYD